MKVFLFLVWPLAFCWHILELPMPSSVVNQAMFCTSHPFFKCLSITWFLTFRSFTSLVCLFLFVFLHHTSFPGTQCLLWLKIRSSRAFSSSTVKRINVSMVIIIYCITMLIINNIVEELFLCDQFFCARTVKHIARTVYI